MPEVIHIGKDKQDTRTLMYSIDNGKVAVHKFPHDSNAKFGMLKLQKFVNRGFTFEDPTKTILYSKLPDGRVVAHRFAFNDERVQEFVERGFTLEDPRNKVAIDHSKLDFPLSAEKIEGSGTADAPLYVSNKPPKKRGVK